MDIDQIIEAERIEAEKEIELEDELAPQAPLELRDKLRREHVFGDGSRIKPARPENLRGMPKVREKVEQIVAFFKNYREFTERGARIQPGILLEGPAGTGKTLTARIIATESGAKLLDAGTFPREDRWWTAGGIGALFSLAREYHAKTGMPVIVYFDRLETVCHRRTDGAATALLSELDGLAGKQEGVFVIGATTRPHLVDQEILRAGRLGYSIRYSRPTSAGRLDILQYYVGRKFHEPMDLQTFSRVMPGHMTPAEIEELVEGAYVKACQESQSGEVRLREAHLVEQLLEAVIGPPEGNWRSQEERYRACVHEAGHVVVGVELGCDPKLAIVPRDGYDRGVTLFDSEEGLSERTVEALIASDFGGSVAEEAVLGDRGFGGTEDVQRATQLSVKLVAKWAKTTNYMGIPDDFDLYENKLLNPLGPGERSRVYAEALRVRERCHQRAGEVLEGFGREGIERVARRIMEREFLMSGDVKRAVAEAKRNREEKPREGEHEIGENPRTAQA